MRRLLPTSACRQRLQQRPEVLAGVAVEQRRDVAVPGFKFHQRADLGLRPQLVGFSGGNGAAGPVAGVLLDQLGGVGVPGGLGATHVLSLAEPEVAVGPQLIQCLHRILAILDGLVHDVMGPATGLVPELVQGLGLKRRDGGFAVGPGTADVLFPVLGLVVDALVDVFVVGPHLLGALGRQGGLDADGCCAGDQASIEVSLHLGCQPVALALVVDGSGQLLSELQGPLLLHRLDVRLSQLTLGRIKLRVHGCPLDAVGLNSRPLSLGLEEALDGSRIRTTPLRQGCGQSGVVGLLLLDASHLGLLGVVLDLGSIGLGRHLVQKRFAAQGVVQAQGLVRGAVCLDPLINGANHHRAEGRL